ncbi:hypothetical protein [Arsenophonus nasoniae]|uniref:Uncharacterized protein n=1 Tax=Arsenophonus nasoniae TaxID=638 RepID=A0AA95GR31_9GAMM|nr:hypothetical protein [Arsenophonus nasoniae]WGM03357.1 hypothetical protein QE210_17615 [Arsenophonus nasoniae]
MPRNRAPLPRCSRQRRAYVLKSRLQIESMFELSFKNPKEIDSNTINQFGYEAVNNKIKEVDYKISHFFKQK